MIKQKNYENAYASIFSIIIFFISFFAAYFVAANDISVAFVKSGFVLIITYAVAKILILIWRFAMPKDEWLLIVHGPPSIESRSVKRNALLNTNGNGGLEFETDSSDNFFEE